jgi:UDP-glucose 4-epimerase
VKVLVTGGSGFIGRPVVAELVREHEVWTAGRQPVPGAQPVFWDLAEPLPRGFPARLDAIVHLAQSRDYRVFPEKAPEIARVNVQATLELLDLAWRSGATRFVFASSGGVYGGGPGAFQEDAPTRPPDFYLSTKVAGEALVNSFRSLFDVVVLRLFFVYGPGQSPDRFFARFVRRVINGEPVTLRGHDGMRLNPVHVLDVADAIARSLRLKGSHVVNVAGPEVVSLRALAEMIGQRVGRPPVFAEEPGDPDRDLVADIRLMKQLLGAPSRLLAGCVGEVCEEAMAAT